jgi:hypothetical protein
MTIIRTGSCGNGSMDLTSQYPTMTTATSRGAKCSISTGKKGLAQDVFLYKLTMLLVRWLLSNEMLEVNRGIMKGWRDYCFVLYKVW